MLTIPTNTRISLCTSSVDMRVRSRTGGLLMLTAFDSPSVADHAKHREARCLFGYGLRDAAMMYDVASLPDDHDQLKSIIITLSQANARQQETLDQLVAEVSRLNNYIEQLLEMIFGKKNEVSSCISGPLSFTFSFRCC